MAPWFKETQAAMLATACLIGGCASAPTEQEFHEAQKRTARCGSPRLDASLSYRVLPTHATVTMDGTRPHAGLSDEAAAVIFESLRESLGKRWKLTVRDATPPGARLGLDPSLRHIAPDSNPPCGQRLALGNDPVPPDEDADILVISVARNLEIPALTRIAVGALIGMLAVGAVFSGQIGAGLFQESAPAPPPPPPEVNYLQVAMVHARSREVLWVRTLVLRPSDSLRNREDARRLLTTIFETK